MLSHANIAANMSQIDAWGCGLFYPPSKVVAILPFFHIFAMTVCMNTPLCNGTQVVMMPRFEMKGFLDLLKRNRPNVLPAVPTLIGAMSKLVILDEPNSNLDAEGETALTEAIRSVKARRGLVIVVAHRPSAIVAVDKLLLLRNGRQVAFGSRAEILASLEQGNVHPLPVRAS